MSKVKSNPMHRHYMMIRTADNKVGYTAFFYDQVNSKFIGETDNIKLGDNVFGNSTPVRKYPVRVTFQGQLYDSFVYEK